MLPSLGLSTQVPSIADNFENSSDYVLSLSTIPLGMIDKSSPQNVKESMNQMQVEAVQAEDKAQMSEENKDLQKQEMDGNLLSSAILETDESTVSEAER